MRQLEQGKIFEVYGQSYRVIASVRQVTADLPQGNDLACVKWHGATKGCHSCQAMKEELTLINLNILLISRYHHLTDTLYNEMEATITATNC